MEVHITSLLLGVAGGLLMWSALVGFFKSIFGGGRSVNVGSGQSVTAGRDAYQAGRDVILNPVPEVPPRPPWWLRDGAPDVRISFGTNRITRVAGGDIRFTTQVREVAIRNSARGNGEWYAPKTGAYARAEGMAFHLGDMQISADDEAEFEIEARFWWGDEERHVLFKDTVRNFLESNTLPISERW